MTKPKSLTEFTLWSSREFLMHIDLCIPPCPYTHRTFSQSLMKQTCFRSMHGRLYNGEWISLIPGHRFLLHITPANHRMEAVRIVSHSDEDHRHHRKEGCWSTLTVLPCPKLQTWQGYYDHRHIAVYSMEEEGLWQVTIAIEVSWPHQALSHLTTFRTVWHCSMDKFSRQVRRRFYFTLPLRMVNGNHLYWLPKRSYWLLVLTDCILDSEKSVNIFTYTQIWF